MVKLYKKYLFIPHYTQGILYLIILLLGIFATQYYRSSNGTWYERNFYEILFELILLITISQILIFSFMYTPLRRLKNDKLTRPKYFAGMSTIAYAFLSFFYIFLLVIDLAYWYDYQYSWGGI